MWLPINRRIGALRTDVLELRITDAVHNLYSTGEIYITKHWPIQII